MGQIRAGYATGVDPANVFVLGLDQRNLHFLHDLPHVAEYRFHQLLGKEELMFGDVDLAEQLERAQRRLDSFDGPVDAIIGYWDFPVSSMVPILCERYGLPGPSLRSVVTCEHKYWCRLAQREVTSACPPFALVDLAESDRPPDLNFPFWLKPVKSYSSALAFRVNDAEEFREAAARIRGKIGRIGAPFDYVLSMLDLPPEIAAAGGHTCLAEEEVSGEQVTAEGYCFRGEPHVYGIIDSLCYPGTPSFQRYQYPSRLPAGTAERIADISRRVIARIGLDNATFNIEFFWDTERDRINVLEVNPRLSQSHAPLFEFVDGVPNYQSMVRIALGRDPEQPHRRGEYGVAAKWFVRRFTDALVVRAPTEEHIAEVERNVPGTVVDVVAEEGRRLSELPAQDSYSYELFALYLGGRDQDDLFDRYRRCVELLPFTFDET